MATKGQGHIEVILSFILFVGFLLFVFMFMDPFSTTTNSGVNMQRVESALLKNMTSEVGKISIILNNSGDCYNLTSPMSKYGNNFTIVQENSRKYTAYFSSVFDPRPDLSCSDSNFSYGLYSKEKMVLYENILALKNIYNSSDAGYLSIKQNLGIINDFSFNVRDMDNHVRTELTAERLIPSGVEVGSVDIPMRIINKTGYVEEDVINIRAW